MRTNPYFVALANGLLPGAGYLILQERVAFGALLLGGTLSVLVLMFVEPGFIPTGYLVSESLLGKVLESLWYGLFTAAYAYDAFTLAHAKRATGVLVTPVAPEPPVAPPAAS